MQAAKTDVGLEQYWFIFKRRWPLALATFGTTAIAISLLGLMQSPLYEAVGKLRFKGQDTTSNLAGIEDDRGQLRSLNSRESPISTEIGLMKTTPVIRETIETLGMKDNDGELLKPQAFLDDLEVSEEKGTDLLKVIFHSPNTEVAKQAVNTLMAVYLEQHLLDNRAEAIAAREFIETQLPDAEDRVVAAEAALREFKERNQVVALAEESLQTVTLLSEANAKVAEVTAQLADAEAQFNSIQARLKQDPQSALIATAASQSTGVQQVLSEYQSVESALAAERVRFEEQHPVVVDLKSKLDNLGRLLSDRINEVAPGSATSLATENLQIGDVEASLIGDYIRLEARINGLSEQEKALQAAESSYFSRADAFPRLEQEQRELNRKLDAAQATYNLLLQRLQEVRVVENKNVGNVRVVQPAEILDESATSPLMLYVVSGLMLGAIVSVAATLLSDANDQSIKTVEEVKDLLALPILGVVPEFSKTSAVETAQLSEYKDVPRLVACDTVTSLASESFHMLRNSLKFLNSDAPPRAIVVTSSVPGEGKSTVATNLAASIAQTNQRVLLVDASLKSPMQHWIWNLGNNLGLSDLLVGKVPLCEAMLAVRPNLMVLVAGSPPPNPAALFDSQKMATLIKSFKEHFDYVILDVPAASSGASTSILGKMSDGILLVARPGVATRKSVGYAEELLARTQQNILGIVVNGTLSKYEPYSMFLSEEFYEEGTAPSPSGVAVKANSAPS